MIKAAIEKEVERSSKATEQAVQEERSRGQKLLEEQKVSTNFYALITSNIPQKVLYIHYLTPE